MRLLASLIAGMLAASLGAAAVAAPAHVHDATLGDVLVSCRVGSPRAAVRAETQSGVSLHGPYAVERQADKGLVHLMSQGGRQTHAYSIPARSIRAVVRVKIDETLPDYAVLAFQRHRLVLIHTSTANAGLFTSSDVYALPYDRLDRSPGDAVKGDVEGAAFLKLGLAAYSRSTGRCVAEAG